MDLYYYEKSTTQTTKTQTSGQSRLACALFALGFMLAFFSPFAHAALQTKIVSVNGKYTMNHATSIQVYTGDVVSFMADQVDSDGFGNANPQNRRAEDFIWSSDIRSTDFCAPAWQDCAGSNFEMHQYGVNFYVPNSMPSQTTLTVINRNDGSYDQITLVYSGGSYAGGGGIGNGNNNGGSFDYNNELTGHGRWVYINGSRVFVPYHYVNNWSPYQHGYWYWTSYGWTWYSYDPWGHVTDHYGYWRHHGVYGWIWSPFSGIYFTYYPSVVSFYYTSYGIGWSPFWSGFGTGYYNGYNHGYNHGYTDGYWDGYNHAINHNHYNTGMTCVTTNNFYSTTNIYNIVETNVTVVNSTVSSAVTAQTFGQAIGVKGGGKADSVAVVQAASASLGMQTNAVPLNVVSAVVKGGDDKGANGQVVPVVRPVDVKPTPVQYQQAQQTGQDRGKNDSGPKIPVGSVINPSNGAVVKPPANVSHPPVKPDGSQVPATGKPPVPTPSRPSEPSRPSPAPAPSRPSEPSRPSPAPAPSRPSEPSRPSPAPVPSRPSEPSRPSPAPAPSRPSEPSRPSPAPAPSRPSEPSRPSPAPAPSRPSNPGGGGGGYRPSPAPSRPSPAPAPSPSRPSPAPGAPSRGGRG